MKLHQGSHQGSNQRSRTPSVGAQGAKRVTEEVGKTLSVEIGRTGIGPKSPATKKVKFASTLRDRICQKCGTIHKWASDACLAAEHVCTYCQKKGHFDQKCPAKGATNKYCLYCNGNSHTTLACTDYWKQIEHRDSMQYCEACYEKGHIAVLCHNPKRFVPLGAFPRGAREGRNLRIRSIPGTVLELSGATPPDISQLPQVRIVRAGPNFIHTILPELQGIYSGPFSEQIRMIVAQIPPALALRMLQKVNEPPCAVTYCVSAWVAHMVSFGFEPWCNYCSRRMLVVDREGDYVSSCYHQLYKKDLFEYVLETCKCWGDGVTWVRREDGV
ncbi:hypothetical protein MBLNU459_g0729t2 [Dothideomycetes sp. NU459]